MQVNASGSSTSDQMLTLLITQLKQQDPLNPLDGVEFTSQLMQMQSLQELMEISEAMQALADRGRIEGPLSLLGRRIAGADAETGELVEGIVEGLDLGHEEVILHVGKAQVRLEDVVSVSASEP